MLIAAIDGVMTSESSGQRVRLRRATGQAALRRLGRFVQDVANMQQRRGVSGRPVAVLRDQWTISIGVHTPFLQRSQARSVRSALVALMIAGLGLGTLAACAPDDESSSQRDIGQASLVGDDPADTGVSGNADGTGSGQTTAPAPDISLSEGALSDVGAAEGIPEGLPSEVPLPPDFNVTASTGEYPALSLSGTVDKGLTQVLTETEAAIKKSAFTEQRRTGSVEEGRVTLFLADQSQRRVAIALASDGARVKVSVTTTPPLVAPKG